MGQAKVTLSDRRDVLDAEVKEGRSLLATTPHGIKLYATVKQGKITNLNAKDKKGKSVEVTTFRARKQRPRGRVTCWVCVETPGGTYCYQVDCDKLPDPL